MDQLCRRPVSLLTRLGSDGSAHVHILSNIDDVEDSPVSAPPLARSARTESTDNSPGEQAPRSALATGEAGTSGSSLGSLPAGQEAAMGGYESDDERPSKRHRPHQD